MRMAVIFVLLAVVMLTGCQNSSVAGPSVETKVAAELAAQREEYDLSQFEEPEAKPDTMNGEAGWMFYYEGKEKLPGNHIMVWIGSETGKPLVLHGE
jgi:hypothetical protein